MINMSQLDKPRTIAAGLEAVMSVFYHWTVGGQEVFANISIGYRLKMFVSEVSDLKQLVVTDLLL